MTHYRILHNVLNGDCRFWSDGLARMASLVIFHSIFVSFKEEKLGFSTNLNGNLATSWPGEVPSHFLGPWLSEALVICKPR